MPEVSARDVFRERRRDGAGIEVRRTATVLGITSQAVYSLIRTRRLRSWMERGLRMVSVDDVERYREERRARLKEQLQCIQ